MLGSDLKGDLTPRKMKVEEVAGSLASEKAGEGGVPVPGEVVIAEKIGGRGSELFSFPFTVITLFAVSFAQLML